MVVDLVAELRARNLRVTPQRRAILEVFSDRADEHLSADEVHARAMRIVPELGRGTVYATLAELAETGLLAAVGSPEPVRYETNTADHHHFRCDLCLRLFDVAIPDPDPRALRDAGFDVRAMRIVAEGVCSDCRAFTRGLQDGAKATETTASLPDELVGGLSAHLHDTPLGTIATAASGEGVVRLAFEDSADFDALRARAKRRAGGRGARERVDKAEQAIDAYFAGEREAALDIIDWSAGITANHDVLEATRKIAFATRRSYAELCNVVSPYDCGYAIGVNPIPLLLPCHRVSLGQVPLEDYVGGRGRRAELERFEHAG